MVSRIAVALLTSAIFASLVPMPAAHAVEVYVDCMRKCIANEKQCREKFLPLYGADFVKQRCVDIQRHNCDAKCVVK